MYDVLKQSHDLAEKTFFNPADVGFCSFLLFCSYRYFEALALLSTYCMLAAVISTYLRSFT